MISFCWLSKSTTFRNSDQAALEKDEGANESQKVQQTVPTEPYNGTNYLTDAKPTKMTEANCSIVKAVKVTQNCHPSKATFFDQASEESNSNVRNNALNV